MKISPVIFSKTCLKFNKTNKNTHKTNEFTPSAKLISYPKEFYFCGNSKTQHFEYSPIGLKRITNELVYNYEDLNKFSKLYSQKLNSQLMPIEKCDIEKLISEINKVTNADIKTIKEILYSLTLFSTYNSLSKFDKIFQKEEISRYGLIYFHRQDTSPNFSSNGCIDYVVNQKTQLPYRNASNGGLLLDGTILNQLENFKNSKTPEDNRTYESLIRQIKSKQIKILSPVGWDIKCSDGKYRSANLFCGTGHLKNLTIDIIKRMQKGEKLEDILYKNNEQKLIDILKDDIDTNEIEFIHFPNINTQKDKSTDDIYENLKIKLFSPKKIEKIIKQYIEKTHPENYSKEAYQIALCKLLDEQSKVYSIDSLAYELKELNSKIKSTLKAKGYQENDILYCVPDASKSFGLINYMYKKVNEIDENNIVGIDSSLNSPLNSTKAKVIIDDISASGLTQEKTCAQLRNKILNYESPICYASLLTCDSALKQTTNPSNEGETIYLTKIADLGALYRVRCTLSDLTDEEKDINDPKDYIKEYKKAFCKSRFKILNPKDTEVLENSLFLGYASSGLSCAFPYMLPDNNNDLASLIFQDILFKNTPEANKTLSVLKMHYPKRMDIYREIEKSL